MGEEVENSWGGGVNVRLRGVFNGEDLLLKIEPFIEKQNRNGRSQMLMQVFDDLIPFFEED